MEVVKIGNVEITKEETKKSTRKENIFVAMSEFLQLNIPRRKKYIMGIKL